MLGGYWHYQEARTLIPFLETEILSFQTAHCFKGQINFYKGTGDASAEWLWENILFMYLACKANMQWCIPFITSNTPCNLSSKAPWWSGNRSQWHLQCRTVHRAGSLGNKITISLPFLPYVILKSKLSGKKLPSSASLLALKTLCQSLERKDSMGLNFQAYDWFLQANSYDIATCI